VKYTATITSLALSVAFVLGIAVGKRWCNADMDELSDACLESQQELVDQCDEYMNDLTNQCLEAMNRLDQSDYRSNTDMQGIMNVDDGVEQIIRREAVKTDPIFGG